MRALIYFNGRETVDTELDRAVYAFYLSDDPERKATLAGVVDGVLMFVEPPEIHMLRLEHDWRLVNEKEDHKKDDSSKD